MIYPRFLSACYFLYSIIINIAYVYGQKTIKIATVRQFYAQAEKGISALSRDTRLSVWASLILYRKILDVIEDNDYDVFRYLGHVSTPQKLLALPLAWWKAQPSPEIL